jgi:cysteine desulfurase/selenocysteine lyase
LLVYAEKELGSIDGVTLVGSAADKEAVISFHIGKQDVKELESYLNDEHNIFVRAGDLSAQPLMRLLEVEGLLRISFSFYNTQAEIDSLVKAIELYLEKNKQKTVLKS